MGGCYILVSEGSSSEVRASFRDSFIRILTYCKRKLAQVVPETWITPPEDPVETLSKLPYCRCLRNTDSHPFLTSLLHRNFPYRHQSLIKCLQLADWPTYLPHLQSITERQQLQVEVSSEGTGHHKWIIDISRRYGFDVIATFGTCFNKASPPHSVGLNDRQSQVRSMLSACEDRRIAAKHC